MDCAFTRGVAAFANHKSEPEANARYVFDEDRNIYTPLLLLNLFIQEKKYFVIMDLIINCLVILLVNMIL